MFIGLSAMFTIIFNLLLFPYAQKTLIVVLAIAAIFSSYHMHYFKVVIDANMIQNVLQTDIHESLDLLSTKFGMWFLLQGAPLLSLYFFKTTYQPKFFSELKSRLIAIIIAALLIAVSVGTAYKTIVIIHRNNRNLISLIIPINCIYYLGKYVKKKNQMPKEFTQIALDAVKGPLWKNVTKRSLLIIVVGEAARSSNFSLNGYARETNPLLKTKNVISLKNVSII